MFQRSCCFFLTLCILKLIARHYIKKNRDLFFSQYSIVRECNHAGNEILELKERFEDSIDELGLNQTCRCSASVVHNAGQSGLRNEVKYLIKYSNIDYSMEDLELIDFCIYYETEVEKFKSGIQSLLKQTKSFLPLLVRIFSGWKARTYLLCKVKLKASRFSKPVFKFLYISPTGKNRHFCEYRIDLVALRHLSNDISGKLTKTEHIRTQRSAMTNDLREAIKQRDNYTCCKCGNSVLKEPNLLLEVDHIVPVSKGGKTEADNLQTLCWRCNRAKGSQ